MMKFIVLGVFMKLIAPKYYKDFVCIADKCKHSCCIGWEIDVDETALDKFKSLDHPYAKSILSSIDISDTPHFRLASDERCPHLDCGGLCKIIKNVGEDYLCDICREHPRFYNFTNRGKEVGLGMSCEEACRLILSRDDFDEFIEICDCCGELVIYDFDATDYITQIYKTLKDSSLSFHSKLSTLCEQYKISIDWNDFLEALSELEYLSDNHKQIICNAEKLDFNNLYEEKLVRALAYFVFRHCSESDNEEELRIYLAFSIALTLLIASISKKIPIEEAARIVSEEIEYSEDNTETIKSIFY